MSVGVIAHLDNPTIDEIERLAVAAEAAGGDWLVLWLLRGVSPGAFVEDHPTRAGCYVLEPEQPPGSCHKDVRQDERDDAPG